MVEKILRIILKAKNVSDISKIIRKVSNSSRTSRKLSIICPKKGKGKEKYASFLDGFESSELMIKKKTIAVDNWEVM